MGNNCKVPHHKPQIAKFDINLVCQKITGHIELEQNREIGLFKTKENHMASLMKSNYPEFTEITMQARTNVTCLNKIKSATQINRMMKLINDRCLLIVKLLNKGQYRDLEFIVPYVEAIWYCLRIVNSKQTDTFLKFFKQFVKENDYNTFREFQRLSSDIRVLGRNPSYKDIVGYVEACNNRHKINFDMEAYLQQNPEPQNIPTPISHPSNNNSNNGGNQNNNHIQGGQINVMSQLELNNYLSVVKQIQAIGV